MYKYFLRERLRNRNFIFWCLAFPLALMLCFHFVFGNLSTSTEVTTLNMAVIYEGTDSMYNRSFETMVDGLTEEGSNGEEALFKLNDYSKAEEVKEALINNDLDLAFKVYDDKVEVLISKDYSDMDIAVGKAVADTFMNNYDMMATAFEENPQKAMELISNLGENLDFTAAKKSEFAEETPNPYIWYYYSSFVMGICFNAMNGVDMVANLKADAGYHAVRVSVSPQRKLRLIISAYCAYLTIALGINVIQLLIMKFALNVPLGGSILKLVAFVLACNLFALAFGVVCGSIMKGTIDARGNKITAIIMTSVFLSGEMVAQLPGMLERSVPIINDINPATVMNMALFRLAYSTGDFDFYINMIKIVLMAVLFITISVLILRREKYASL
ncbi:MAG: ABC transporter permease [Clostridia bacterium]|nr:ABC transporter permease [Clostridia bacterium]